MSDLVNRLRIKAGMIEMGELIAWGSDSALMLEAADALEMAVPAAQGELVGYVSPRLLKSLRSGKACGITMEDKPDVNNGVTIPLFTAVLQPDAVQMEVVGWQFYQDGKWWNGDDRIKDHKRNTQEAGFRTRNVYAVPQSADVRLDKQCRQDVAAALGFPSGGNYAWSYLLQQIKDVSGLAVPAVQTEPEYGSTPQYINDAIDNLAHANYELSYAGYQERTRDVELIRTYVARTLQPAEQQPAPEVTALVEALELMVSTHDEGGWPTAAITIARAALATYREQGGEA